MTAPPVPLAIKPVTPTEEDVASITRHDMPVREPFVLEGEDSNKQELRHQPKGPDEIGKLQLKALDKINDTLTSLVDTLRAQVSNPRFFLA